MVKRLMLSLAGLALGVALVAPAPAFARMHFTTTNERLDALVQRANSSVSLTNPAEIATQLNEITTQAQAAKAAAEEAAQRPASGAEDKSVLAKVGTDMDAVVAAANTREVGDRPADQQTALKEIQTKAQDSSTAVKQRIAGAACGPGAAPAAEPDGPAVLRPGERARRGPEPAGARRRVRASAASGSWAWPGCAGRPRLVVALDDLTPAPLSDDGEGRRSALLPLSAPERGLGGEVRCCRWLLRCVRRPPRAAGVRPGRLRRAERPAVRPDRHDRGAARRRRGAHQRGDWRGGSGRRDAAGRGGRARRLVAGPDPARDQPLRAPALGAGRRVGHPGRPGQSAARRCRSRSTIWTERCWGRRPGSRTAPASTTIICRRPARRPAAR